MGKRWNSQVEPTVSRRLRPKNCAPLDRRRANWQLAPGRAPARNFYDLWYLSQQREQVDWTKVSSILQRKSAVRGVSITSLADVFQPTLISDVRASWTGTLGQFISELPEVDRVLAELQSHLNQLLKL